MDQALAAEWGQLQQWLTQGEGLDISTDYSGSGMAELCLRQIKQVLHEIGVPAKVTFHRACDILPHARAVLGALAEHPNHIGVLCVWCGRHLM